MRKISIYLLASALFISCAEEKKPVDGLELSGTIKGFKKGTLYIQRIKDDSLLVPIDSIMFAGTSEFKTHIDLKHPEMLYLFIDRGVSNSVDNNLPFFAEPGSMTVETSLDYFTADAVIKGSKNQELYDQYKIMMSRLIDKNLELIQLGLIAKKDNNVSRLDSIQKEQDENLKRRYLITTNFIVNNSNYEIAPYIALAEIPDVSLKYLDTIDKSMSPKISKTKYGKKLRTYAAERRKLGQ
ncbi:DUF4369 domain-containing protein [Flavobacterium sp.]|jgi:hypothetical protein|uniref:DUF4369 domain-containing protein n=1 Tax=Flavobacterium sp. TaxID=239 RepID=UPI0022BFD27C|nr:DUF4369 domain-containing protein [Flavobacterium sp.]MCZ8145755.1 DUF4369 domain-containing protein [Flavobacterium sp.]MCZ8367395.1 DUF4369 domain-containing protein [Flavobacterium sp.]